MEPLPLLPEAPSPRRCRCGRPVPKGPLVEGWGSGCAVEHGVTPAPTPRVTTVRQEGESLLDLLNGDAHRFGGNGGVAECPELRGKGVTVEDMLEWFNGVLDWREAVARAASDGGRWRYSGGDTVGAWTLYDEHWSIASMTVYDTTAYDYSERMPAARHPGYIDPDAVGEHAALNDPKQILADVAADRAILAEHAIEYPDTEFAYCAVCHDHDRHDAAAAPCRTLRLLAAKYTAWPGDQPSWAPEGSRG